MGSRKKLAIKRPVKKKKATKVKSNRLSVDTVMGVARIARLYLTDDEAKRFSKDLNDVLRAFKELDTAKTRGVEPSFQPLPVKNVFRDDVIEPSINNEEALRNTNHKEKKFFRGPRAV